MSYYNVLNQPIGQPLPDWSPPPLPPHTTLAGRSCLLEPLNPDRHAQDLYAANGADASGQMWTYLPYGPFPSFATYRHWMDQAVFDAETQFYAIIPATTGRAAGVACYLRMVPNDGSLEVGHLAFAPSLQRTVAATEAMIMMIEHAFGLGYRRYEWRCNALNAASRAAAQRLGLSFEGLFRQARIVKGHSRDTACYAALGTEWPALQAAYSQWLAPANFNAQGQQRVRLSTLTRPLLHPLCPQQAGSAEQMP
ncbi:MAG: N-acetyltransferase [Chloroflexia bacterium]|nr:N-acetyltransferase [Chloroflexia bacterium]